MASFLTNELKYKNMTFVIIYVIVQQMNLRMEGTMCLLLFGEY